MVGLGVVAGDSFGEELECQFKLSDGDCVLALFKHLRAANVLVKGLNKRFGEFVGRYGIGKSG